VLSVWPRDASEEDNSQMVGLSSSPIVGREIDEPIATEVASRVLAVAVDAAAGAR
jgi:uncharacterized protein YwlG (UPF0340 family)